MTADDHVEFLRDMVAAVRCVPRHLLVTLRAQSEAMARTEGVVAIAARLRACHHGTRADEAEVVREREAVWNRG